MTQVSQLPRAGGVRDDHTLPEQRLMMATIATAVSDALGNGLVGTPGQRERQQAEAIAWFRGAGSDFRFVCHVAGLDPAHVRKCVMEFLASGRPMPRNARVTDPEHRRWRARLDDEANTQEAA